MKSLVLISGGIDSALTYKLAQLVSNKTDGLHISYGQNTAEAEFRSAKRLCEHNDAVLYHHTISGWQSECALMNNISTTDSDKNYLPARNIIFLSLATAIAVEHKYTHIWIGGYGSGEGCESSWDTKPAFTSQMQTTIQLGTNTDIEILQPLKTLTKDAVYQLVHTLDPTILNFCVGCFVSDPPCNECEWCVINKRYLGWYDRKQQ